MKRTELALALFDIGAVKVGEFRLKMHEDHPDAPLSPFYIDLRILQSYPKVIKQVADILVEKIKEDGLKPEIISGIPDSAIPIASLVMERIGIPMITLRRHNKTYGIPSSIMGIFHADQSVLLIDDVVTRADSKLKIIASLEKFGLTIKDILVLIDREQGGKQELAKRGYRLHPVFGIRELFKLYRSEEAIKEDQYRKTMNYLDLFSS